jgi:hypothetical protein
MKFNDWKIAVLEPRCGEAMMHYQRIGLAEQALKCGMWIELQDKDVAAIT